MAAYCGHFQLQQVVTKSDQQPLAEMLEARERMRIVDLTYCCPRHVYRVAGHVIL